MARILLVDDAADTRHFLAEKILVPEGYAVDIASHAEEALALLAQRQPDLIISDYLMPGLTGLDFLAAVQSQGFEIPFILITAEGSEALAVRALRMGVRDYLIKPFDIDDLLQAIHRVISTPVRRTYPAQEVAFFSLLNDVSSLLIHLDENQQVRFVNWPAQQALGLAEPGLPQPASALLVHPDLQSLLASAELREAQLQLPNQRTYNVEVASRPGLGQLVMLHDVTTLKELDRVKSDFVTAVSHDVRSPLTTILGYLDLIGRAGPLNEQQRKFTQHILFSVRSITELISDLLDLSKIEAGFDINLEPTPLDVVLRYAAESLLTTLEAKQHRLSVDISPHLPPIMGNALRLKQLMGNLLQNAIKYTPPGGQISLHLYADDGFVVLQVADNGIGIPLEEQPYIWDKFFRSENAVDDYPGTGLGLSIVKTIVDAHRGRIWVDSAPGRGSVFTVMFSGIHDDTSPTPR
ncbi:MAG: response regulator [Anaerolineae bacterium]|nr:response regulator [Anaerolineae bacterium]